MGALRGIWSITACALAFTCGAQLPGLSITGDPATFPGASWTYQATDEGVLYDLSGILRKPAGSGPFPAVIINHGTGGNANGYSRAVANEMVSWGYVGIGANLTHSGGVPCGAPGECTTAEYGSSPNNILRSLKCWDILASLGCVDTTCIASFGHSRGAWLTTGLVAAHPDKFSVAGHTAGGVNDDPLSTAPSTTEAAAITCAYIIQHGDSDTTVPIAWDERLDSVFTANGTDHEFIPFPGYTHAQISQDPAMYDNVQNWFALHGCGSATTIDDPQTSDGMVIEREAFDALGRRIALSNASGIPPDMQGMIILRERLADGSVRVRRTIAFGR